MTVVPRLAALLVSVRSRAAAVASMQREQQKVKYRSYIRKKLLARKKRQVRLRPCRDGRVRGGTCARLRTSAPCRAGARPRTHGIPTAPAPEEYADVCECEGGM